MKKVIKYFLQGLLYVVPLWATAFVLYKSFVFLDGLIGFAVPGLGILLILVAITIIGFIGTFLITLPITVFIERLLKRAPLIKLIYTSVQDVVSAFLGKKKGFNKPVVVKLYEASEVKRIGFITSESMKQLGMGEDEVAVYVPHSYAFSGQLFFVPESYVTPIDANATDVMKFIVSGGVTNIEDGEKG